jgi:hypothetical protein
MDYRQKDLRNSRTEKIMTDNRGVFFCPLSQRSPVKERDFICPSALYNEKRAVALLPRPLF